MITTEPQRSNALRKQIIIRFGLAGFLIPVILFAMAGTVHYWQGWLYWMVLLIPMVAAVNYFLRTDPELLERRMKYKEKESEQRTIILLDKVVLVAGFLAIAIDLRLHGLNQRAFELDTVCRSSTRIERTALGFISKWRRRSHYGNRSERKDK